MEKVGHDKRGNPTFKRDRNGNEIFVPEKEENDLVFGETKDGVKTVAHPRMVRISDDQSLEVPAIFRDWKKREGITW